MKERKAEYATEQPANNLVFGEMRLAELRESIFIQIGGFAE